MGEKKAMGEERRTISVKRTSNHSEQWLFREEVLSFTRKKAKAFSSLFVPPQSGRMEIRMGRGLRAAVGAALLALLLTGCTLMSEEKVKLRDLEFTILSEEKIPQELMTIIEEKQGEPFKLTYSDNENLYISIGYGEQSSGGFSITVNELYLTENAIYVNTTLLGPDASENTKKAASCPYIVIKTELLEETVIFE